MATDFGGRASGVIRALLSDQRSATRRTEHLAGIELAHANRGDRTQRRATFVQADRETTIRWVAVAPPRRLQRDHEPKIETTTRTAPQAGTRGAQVGFVGARGPRLW